MGIMILLVLTLMVTMGGRLVALQNEPDSNYPVAAEATTIEYQAIPAARGEILDIYGRPLVSNRLGLNLMLDEARLKKAENPAAEVLKLLQAAEACGVAWRDTMPVTAPPYAYDPLMTKTQEERLAHFWEKKGYDAMDADALIAQLSLDYGVPETMNATQVRQVVGIFYELELRTLFTRVKPYRYIEPYVFAEDINIELVSRVKEQNFAGCVIEPVSTRVYETEFAAHILGRVGRIPADEIDYYTQELGYQRDDIVGVDGAEKAFEAYLRGKPGQRAVETTADGSIRRVFYSTEPEPGKNIYLTMDLRFQQRVEQILADGIRMLQETSETLKGKEADAGAIAVVDVNSGAILALASYPTYNLLTIREDYASLLEDPLTPLINRTISGTYAPGSTFKMVTATAALESGLINGKTRIFDEGKYTYYKDYQPTCLAYPGTHGSINVSDALKVSCNYFFYDIGFKMGIAAVRQWAEKFGLGQLSGVELSGERAGYIAGPETSSLLHTTWQGGLTLAASIGQSDNWFTPLQLANYVAAIANGGTVYQTHLLREAKSNDYTQTHVINTGEVLQETGVSADTIRLLQQGMNRVAHEQGGSAYSYFKDYPVNIAAKTGSVQTGNRPNNGVFVAYGPYEEPEIALCVVIEKGGAGSRVAPIARNVFDTWFELKNEMQSAGKENILQK